MSASFKGDSQLYKHRTEDKSYITPLFKNLLGDADFNRDRMFKTNMSFSTSSHDIKKPKYTDDTKHCLKCFLVKRLWMISVNMYDIMGLLDICPCGTLHSIRPYIS